MRKTTNLDWKGAWAAIPTPFKENGDLDCDALRRHLTFLCEHEIDGIVTNATTGEGVTMTIDEKSTVIKIALEITNGRIPVIAGVGTNDTRTTIENARAAHTAGANGLLVVTPYYNKPNQEGQYQHFMAVANAVELPQILYNVPGRTGTRCLPETLARLSTHPNIVGIKDATADMLVATQTRKLADENFLMFSGDDGTTLPFISVGGIGAISVVANVAPKLMHDIITLALQHRYKEARSLHEHMIPLFLALFSDTSPIPLKAILHSSKLQYPNTLRSPLFAMTDAQRIDTCTHLAKFIEEIE
jgi:4-hydroxy-tetrahydrodipicolinate synthase